MSSSVIFSNNLHPNNFPNRFGSPVDMSTYMLTPGMHGPLNNPNPAGPFSMAESNRGVLSSKIASVNARMGQSMIGRSIRQGTLEAFGWQFDGSGNNFGFLGKVPDHAGYSSRAQMNNAVRNVSRTAAKTAPTLLGQAGSLAVRSIGLASTAYFAYQGYQQDGVWGAMRDIGMSVGSNIAFTYASAALGGAALGPLALAAAAGGAVYAIGESGRKKMNSLRTMELSGGDQMQQAIGSAGALTSRQRAMQALNNSHLNHRMAIGNEAFLMHRTFS